ncbi:FAD-dependent monooxygenase [Paenibacillus sp. NPDC058071]|uniref:FAD-dependent monooxygenase n=1 Tax=Paenibacillus sp. NPDC058071 TaxID=3346326 RepID=UPI0036DA8ADE
MYDVIVVGAGPAGSVLARQLALQGVKVLMLDAARFPRRKPCGESVNPGGVELLRRLFDLSEEEGSNGSPQAGGIAGAGALPFPFPYTLLSGWRLSGSGAAAALEAEFPAGLRGIGCRRDLLDDWLVQQACLAGVQFEDRTRVERLVWEDGAVSGVEARSSDNRLQHISATFVAGADGIRSAIARSAALSRFGPLRKAALTARVNGMEGLSDKVELFIRGDSVVGIAPIGAGQANVTVSMRSPQAAARAAAVGKAECLLQEARSFDELSVRLRFAVLEGEVLACGPFDRPVKEGGKKGIVLVGDASGYFDPLTGQGIYRAMRSAELAAPALLEALSGGSGEPLVRYSKRRSAEFAGAVRLQRWIERVSRHPWLWQGAIAAIGSSTALTSKLARTIGDCR